jgi:2-dehydro-3-deoxyphosphogluconate aldolase/(4S)-4-hydroxy-2-oxoglutarate aldolase
MNAAKSETLGAFAQWRISAVLRTNDPRVARQAMEAAVAGGIRIAEFTMNTPEALSLIAEFSSRPELVVGAGTVLTAEQAREARQAGARFIVSPVCDPLVIAEGNSLGAVTVPGTFTPTEMMSAHRAGADMVKLFPMPGIGPQYVEFLLAPMPFLKIFPTAGVTVDNFLDFLAAGAWGVGMTTSLFDPKDLAARRFERIRRRAEEITRRFKEWGGIARS